MSNRHKSLLIALIILVVLCMLSGCRTPQRLIQIACDRDPAVCNPPVLKYKLDAPIVTTSIDCEKVLRGFEIIIPREYKDQGGNTKIDTVRASLTPDLPKFEGDTAKTGTLSIDCPDPEVIKVSYPVIVPPTFWQKLQYYIGGGVIAIVLVVALNFLKKFIP